MSTEDLITSASRGDIAGVEKHLSAEQLKYMPGFTSRLLLYRAMSSGNPELVKYLIRKGIVGFKVLPLVVEGKKFVNGELFDDAVA